MNTQLIAAATLIDDIISGVTSGRVSPGLEIMAEATDGTQYATAQSVGKISPSAEFGVLSLATMASLAITGTALSSSAASLSLYTVETEHTAARKTTGLKFAFSDGLVVPLRLSAAFGGFATLTYGVFGAKDDGSAPLTLTTGQTIPTAAVDFNLFTLGAVTIDSTAVGGVQGVDIDFGYDVAVVHGDGLVYPQAVYIRAQRPTLSIATIASTAAAAVGLAGTADLVTAQLMRCSRNGVRDTTGHLTFSTHSNHVRLEAIGGDSGGDVATAIVCAPVYDGTNAPVTLAGLS